MVAKPSGRGRVAEYNRHADQSDAEKSFGNPLSRLSRDVWRLLDVSWKWALGLKVSSSGSDRKGDWSALLVPEMGQGGYPGRHLAANDKYVLSCMYVCTYDHPLWIISYLRRSFPESNLKGHG
jgi:hypothetical protein